MAHVWPYDPEVPSPALTALWQGVEDEARRVAAAARRRMPMRRVSQSLAIWSAVLERLAVSGPTHHRDLLRTFEDHPRHGEDDLPRSAFREMADVLAFVGIGDQVLDDLARALLASRHQTPAAHLDAWGLLLGRMDDPAEPERARRRVRALQVSLRDARHRLLAHRRSDHAEIVSWEMDDSPRVDLIGLRANGRRSRIALAALNEGLDLPYPDAIVAQPRDYIGLVADQAPTLTSAQLRLLSEAMREVGYVSVPVTRVVGDVLVLSSELT